MPASAFLYTFLVACQRISTPESIIRTLREVVYGTRKSPQIEISPRTYTVSAFLPSATLISIYDRRLSTNTYEVEHLLFISVSGDSPVVIPTVSGQSLLVIELELVVLYDNAILYSSSVFYKFLAAYIGSELDKWSRWDTVFYNRDVSVILVTLVGFSPNHSQSDCGSSPIRLVGLLTVCRYLVGKVAVRIIRHKTSLSLPNPPDRDTVALVELHLHDFEELVICGSLRSPIFKHGLRHGD